MKQLIILLVIVSILLLGVVTLARDHPDGKIEFFSKKFNWPVLKAIAEASYSVFPKGQSTVAVAETVGGQALNTAENVFTGVFGLNGILDRLWRAGGIGQVLVLVVGVVVVSGIVQRFNAVSSLKNTASGLLSPLGWGPVPMALMAGSALWLVNTISNLGGAASVTTFLAGDPNFQTSNVAGALLPMGLWMILWGVISYSFPAKATPEQAGNWVVKHVFIQLPLLLVAIGFLFGDVLSNLPDVWPPIKALFEASSSLALTAAGNKTTLFSVSLPILVIVAAWTFRRAGVMSLKKK